MPLFYDLFFYWYSNFSLFNRIFLPDLKFLKQILLTFFASEFFIFLYLLTSFFFYHLSVFNQLFDCLFVCFRSVDGMFARRSTNKFGQ